jgi:sporulation protein YlmC with PRC-barrel domain
MLLPMTESVPVGEAPDDARSGPVLLSEIVGRPVSDEQGRPLGRLRDLGVGVGVVPRVTCVYAGDRGAPAPVRSKVRVDGVGVLAPQAPGVGAEELRLARDVLDRQVYDAGGRRLTRVGDVVLDRQGEILTVAGIDTGTAAILRRIGLRRAAARCRLSVAAWSNVHLLSGLGHELQLRVSGSAVHRLDNAALVELVRRSAVGQGEAVLAALGQERRAEVGDAVAQATPRRRSSDPLEARKHAPA